MKKIIFFSLFFMIIVTSVYAGSDECLHSSLLNSETLQRFDICTVEGCGVWENFCSDDVVLSQFFECDFGCFMGACLKSPIELSVSINDNNLEEGNTYQIT